MVTIAASSERTRERRERDAFFIVEANRVQLEEVARLIDSGALRVVVSAIFPLADGRSAYQCHPEHGKVVLRVRE
jgi:NADPH:quinone reductase-like Zn-dependent oxidoreductase